MAEQYTPNDEDMRWHYAVKRMDDGATRTHAEQEYRRWITAHDAEVKAEALRGAAKAYEAEGLDVNTESMPSHDGLGYVTVSQWLRTRADQIEKENP